MSKSLEKALIFITALLVFQLFLQFFLALEPLSKGALFAPAEISTMVKSYGEMEFNSPYEGKVVVGNFYPETWCKTVGKTYTLQYVTGLNSWVWTFVGSNILFRPYTTTGSFAAWQVEKTYECQSSPLKVYIWRFQNYIQNGNFGLNSPLNNLENLQ